MAGHFKKANVAPARFTREVLVEGEETRNPGDKVMVDIFNPNELVHVVGTSKGRGFAGFVKRHHFRGGRATHGSMFHRAPGSIGSSAYPSRVLKGMRMAGHMGNSRVTVRNVRVARVDQENNLLFVHAFDRARTTRRLELKSEAAAGNRGDKKAQGVRASEKSETRYGVRAAPCLARVRGTTKRRYPRKCFGPL
jgi:large subunit ribosomal protein L3